MISLESGPSREFEVWIREWPARATIGWIWPGLEDGMMAQTDEGGGGGGGGGSTSWRVEGVCNCLGHIPPHIKTVTYHQRKSDLSPTNANARLGDEWGERGEGEGVHGGGGGGDAIFHATTFLPIGIELPEHRQGQVEEISWLEEEDEAMMVSIELTTICVGQYASGAGIWLVLDGKRGGEKMKGWVYRGGFGMRPDDIIAKSWIEYLEQELRRAEELVEETKKI